MDNTVPVGMAAPGSHNSNETPVVILTPTSSQEDRIDSHNPNPEHVSYVYPYTETQTYNPYGLMGHLPQQYHRVQQPAPIQQPAPHPGQSHPTVLYEARVPGAQYGHPQGYQPVPSMPLRDSRTLNGGAPINYQPWRQHAAPEYGTGPDIDACSNVAVANEGSTEGNMAQSAAGAIGYRMMDFRSELERAAYVDGWGLPHEGDSAEARLMRAINMNHYILIGHVDKAQREMKQYVSTTVNKVVEHSQNFLGKKMRLIHDKIEAVSKKTMAHTRPMEPFPGQEPQDAPDLPETEENNSLQHLEIAILKLWDHVDKIKAEDQLRNEEKVERKELEEILADQLLHHNRTMDKMQAKIASMNRELATCWAEIRKLQHAVKDLDSAAGSSAANPTNSRGLAREESSQIPVTPTSPVADPEKLLQKINKELENLDCKHKAKEYVDSWDPESKVKWNPGAGEDDDCGCDLCGKVKAGEQAEIFQLDSEDSESEGVRAPTSSGRKLTVGERLAALNCTAIDHAIVTNVTPSSPIFQKWRDVYRRRAATAENLQVLELMRPNGDIIILLVQPNHEGLEKAPSRGYGLFDIQPNSRRPGSSVDINVLEIINPIGPYPKTIEEAFAAMCYSSASEDAYESAAEGIRTLKRGPRKVEIKEVMDEYDAPGNKGKETKGKEGQERSGHGVGEGLRGCTI